MSLIMFGIWPAMVSSDYMQISTGFHYKFIHNNKAVEGGPLPKERRFDTLLYIKRKYNDCKRV